MHSTDQPLLHLDQPSVEDLNAALRVYRRLPLELLLFEGDGLLWFWVTTGANAHRPAFLPLIGQAWPKPCATVSAFLTSPRTTAVPAVVRAAGDRQPWRVRTDNGVVAIPVDPVLGLSSLIMVRDAVRRGVGAARLPISLVSHDLAYGALVHRGEMEAPEVVLWTLYPARRLLSARVAAFLDHLTQAFPNGTPDEFAAYLGR